VLERIATRAPLAPVWPRWLSWRRILVVSLVTALLLAAGWFAWQREEPGAAAASEPSNAAPTNLVTLTPEKLKVAELHVTPVERRELCETRRVPGRIQYNQNRRLDVKLPVAGVVVSVLVQPGQRVKSGDHLALLASTEVGLARAEVTTAAAELDLANREAEWASQVSGNLAELAEQLAGHPEMSAIERDFDQRTLGSHRDLVLSSYSKLLVAQQVADSTESVAATGGVSGLLARERKSAREVAAAQFKSALEQSLFDASQDKVRTAAARESARQRVAVREQNLKLLLGPYAEISGESRDAASSELVLRAPIDGIVDARPVTDGSQFSASQLLFTLTNPDTLWVSAHIYDREWALLNELEVKQVSVEAPAVPDAKISARMLFVSASTSSETGSVPLVAEFENSGQFKPGMFAWVSIPVSTPREVLAVPAAAVSRHDGKDFVFVEESPGKYRRVDVELGPAAADAIEVESGLQGGEKVVDRGVFVLKSEMLLGEAGL